MIKNTIIHELINQLRRIKPETIYARSISGEALEEAANANRDQLWEGKLSDGSQMHGYAPNTVADTWNIRTRKVTATEPISFNDTGSFHKSIKAKVNRTGDLVFDSRAKTYKKSKDYIEVYTQFNPEAILGITDENLLIWYKVFVEQQFQKMLIDRILTK